MGQGLVAPLVIVEHGFDLCRWDVVEVAVAAGGAMPVHPTHGGWFDVFDVLRGDPRLSVPFAAELDVLDRAAT